MSNTIQDEIIYTNPYTVIVVPPNCHVMVPASHADILAQIRFAKIDANGTQVKPLPVVSIQSITIPVQLEVLTAIDNASFKTATPSELAKPTS